MLNVASFIRLCIFIFIFVNIIKYIRCKYIRSFGLIRERSQYKTRVCKKAERDAFITDEMI